MALHPKSYENLVTMAERRFNIPRELASEAVGLAVETVKDSMPLDLPQVMLEHHVMIATGVQVVVLQAELVQEAQAVAELGAAEDVATQAQLDVML